MFSYTILTRSRFILSFNLSFILSVLLLAVGSGGALTARGDTTPTVTVLHTLAPINLDDVHSGSEFIRNDGGAEPIAGLTDNADGYLYGTAQTGGANGTGALFRIQPDGAGFQTLHEFGPVHFDNSTFIPKEYNADGMHPNGELTPGRDGYLYGTTYSGGDATANAKALNSGTFFRLHPDGTGFQVLHVFDDGGCVQCALVLAGDGRFYGAASQGGSGYSGGLFRISPDGSGYTVLHSFSGGDGLYPNSLMLRADGLLYGTASYGGFVNGVNGRGTVFRMALDGTGFTVVHSFPADTDYQHGKPYNANTGGSFPRGGVADGQDGWLYGTTYYGGVNGNGTAYRVRPDGSAFETLHVFSATDDYGVNADGRWPMAGLRLGRDGHLYGSTILGGDQGGGLIFALARDGSGLTSLHSLAGKDGGSPEGAFYLPPDGALYGTTYSDGTNSAGTIFRLDGAVGPAPAASSPAHLLWVNTNGTAAVWNLSDPNPAATAFVAGPYPNWTPKAIAQGPDGHVRLLWTNTDGRAALWNLADPNPSATCPLYGPYSGWTATALTVGPDNAAHLLWDNADGRVSLWNTTDANPAATALVEGPYSGWSGVAIGLGSNGQERLLWDNTSGQASVWNLSDANPAASSVLYGPFGGWTAKRLSVGDDNAAHLLWDNVSGQVSLWNLSDANPAASCIGVRDRTRVGRVRT